MSSESVEGSAGEGVAREAGLDSLPEDVAVWNPGRTGPALKLRVRVRYVDGPAGEDLGRAQAVAVRAAMRALGLVEGEG